MAHILGANFTQKGKILTGCKLNRAIQKLSKKILWKRTTWSWTNTEFVYGKGTEQSFLRSNYSNTPEQLQLKNLKDLWQSVTR